MIGPFRVNTVSYLKISHIKKNPLDTQSWYSVLITKVSATSWRWPRCPKDDVAKDDVVFRMTFYQRWEYIVSSLMLLLHPIWKSLDSKMRLTPLSVSDYVASTLKPYFVDDCIDLVIALLQAWCWIDAGNFLQGLLWIGVDTTPFKEWHCTDIDNSFQGWGQISHGIIV